MPSSTRSDPVPLVSLELVRQHLRVDDNDEDALISAYQAAAEATVARYLDRPIYADDGDMPSVGDDGYDQYQMRIQPPIVAAVLLLVDDLFNERAPDPTLTGDALLPRAVRALLAPYRVWRQDCET